MTDILNLSLTPIPSVNRYVNIGLPNNPFIVQDVEGQLGPMYVEHLDTVLKPLEEWIITGLTGFVTPLSIKGSIGVGKTRLLFQVQAQINRIGPTNQVYAAYARIDKTGYSRPSIGQMVLEALDEAQFSDAVQQIPEGVIPALWMGVVSSDKLTKKSRMGEVINRLKQSSGDDRVERARLVCRWLRRQTLSASQTEKIGLYGRVDYEGQLPEILADLLRCLRELGVLKQLYFMVDQLEDVFRLGYSELRRSRILTDLRSLIDEIDNYCPIALILAWSPEVNDPGVFMARATDTYLNSAYPALYSRLTRNMLTINKLNQFHAVGFTAVYLDRVKELPGFDPKRAPKAADLADDAWKRLVQERKAIDNRATPRDLLTALHRTVEILADSQ